MVIVVVVVAVVTAVVIRFTVAVTTVVVRFIVAAIIAAVARPTAIIATVAKNTKGQFEWHCPTKIYKQSAYIQVSWIGTGASHLDSQHR